MWCTTWFACVFQVLTYCRDLANPVTKASRLAAHGPNRWSLLLLQDVIAGDPTPLACDNIMLNEADHKQALIPRIMMLLLHSASQAIILTTLCHIWWQKHDSSPFAQRSSAQLCWCSGARHRSQKPKKQTDKRRDGFYLIYYLPALLSINSKYYNRTELNWKPLLNKTASKTQELILHNMEVSCLSPCLKA